MNPNIEIQESTAAVTGRMRFGSDFPPRRDALSVHVVRAPFARARIESYDAQGAKLVPGVRAVLTAQDVMSGHPILGSAEGGSGLALLASGEVQHYGQAVALIVAESPEAARAGAEVFQVHYQPLPPVLKIDEALEVSQFHAEPDEFERGDLAEAMEEAEHRLSGSFQADSQDPQWPDSPSAHAEPDGSDGVKIFTGSRRPARLQESVAQVLGLPMNRVRIEVPPNHAAQDTAVPAGLAALACWATGCATTVEYDADESRVLQGHRPAVRVDFEAGYNYEGRIFALDVTLSLDTGCAVDTADGFFASVLHHIDNAYWLPNIRIKMQLLKTHRPPRTGVFGGAAGQSLFAVEEIVSRVARKLGIMPEVVRQRNFYHAEGMATTTPAGMEIEAGKSLLPLWKRILASSKFAERRKAIDVWNRGNQFAKRGLAATPVKMGLGDPSLGAVQSSALVHILPDASVQVFADASGRRQIERIRACVSEELGVAAHDVRVLPASTDQALPVRIGERTFPFLGEQAVRHACQRLRDRLLPMAALVFHENGSPGTSVSDIAFHPGRVVSRSNPNLGFSFENFIRYATSRHVDMSASGSAFIEDGARPYHGFLFGAAVSEVQVDSFTGEVQVLRSDLAHEMSSADQIDGGAASLRAAFLEGLGWLLTEVNVVSDDGKPLAQLSHSQMHASLSPGIADAPLDFRVDAVETPDRPGDTWLGGYGLALSLREAVKDAIVAFGSGKDGSIVELPVPATPEAVFRQIHQQRAAAARAR